MPANVSVERAQPRIIAAVRRRVAIGSVGSAWSPALDLVWAFLRGHPGLRDDGHNIFLYHHPAGRDEPMEVDFGVEVTRRFERSGEVYATETPAGEIATAVHVGPYERMKETHDAIHDWTKAHQRRFAGHSWEIYADPTPDPSSLETTIAYLLR